MFYWNFADKNEQNILFQDPDTSSNIKILEGIIALKQDTRIRKLN